jgi:hypothetical protein
LKDDEKITVFDIPSLFQLSLSQESQQETIEQFIVELQATNERVEKLSKIAYEQSKLLETLFRRIEAYENSRDRFRKAA